MFFVAEMGFHYGYFNVIKTFRKDPALTHYSELEAEWALSCFIWGDAGVRPVISLSQRVNNQRMDPVFSHEHSVSEVWIYGLPVEKPHDFRMR